MHAERLANQLDGYIRLDIPRTIEHVLRCFDNPLHSNCYAVQNLCRNSIMAVERSEVLAAHKVAA